MLFIMFCVINFKFLRYLSFEFDVFENRLLISVHGAVCSQQYCRYSGTAKFGKAFRTVTFNNDCDQLFLFLYEYSRHEIACGYYRVSSYFISKVFCDLVPMRLFPLLIFSSITYFMVGKQLFLKHGEEYKANFSYIMFEKNKIK